MFRSVLSFLMLFVFASESVRAVPAYPYPVEMSMPDGSRIAIRICGDENFHFYMSIDGYALLPDDDGQLCYAMLDDAGRLCRSGVKAHSAGLRTASEVSFLGGIDQSAVIRRLGADRDEAAARRTKRRADGFTDLLTSYPSMGSPKALILLVAFKDQPFMTPDPHGAFTDLMTKEGYDYNGATGSARDYFVDNSRGMFTPDFDVYGPVTLPNDMAYYGRETGNLHDINPYQMVADACSLLDDEVDFSQYDEDGDGFVDNVFIFYAGYGQNSGAPSYTIWPHAANIYTYGNISLVLDGVQIGNYACTNEIQGTEGTVRAGIGTFCHEFSHVLGLPDLYATDGTASFTPGQFELMDVGPYLNNGNTPPYMSVYDRMTLKWINPRELSTGETVVLKPFGDVDPATEDEAFIITTISENEYFLLENRQQSGWDSYIPGHGMLVWHIDYDPTLWKNNHVNSTSYSQHLRVDIVEADNLADANTYAGDPFPGANNVTSFTDLTNPSMKTWTNIKVGKPITNIHEQDGVISFDILGGGERIEAVEALQATDVTPVSFTANWTGRSEIYVYEVDLVRKDEIVPLKTFVKETASLSDCSLTISGLEPSAEYYYVVRAVSGDKKSPASNRVYVTTSDPTFDMFSVTALEASEVKSSSFRAEWMPLDGADGYRLSVYTKDFVAPEYDKVDFSDALSLPDGWFTNCTSTSGMAGTYGDAKPSVRMTVDNDLVSSPVYDADISELSFWYRGASGVEGTLSVEMLKDGLWTTLETIDVTGSTVATTALYNYESSPKIPSGCRSIRIVFNRVAGTMYIDDINIGYSGAAELYYCDGFDHADVGNVTDKEVSGLSPETDYYYSILAYKDGLSSAESDEIHVLTSDSSLIAPVAAGASGVRVSASDGHILVQNIDGSDKDVSVSDPAGRIVYRSLVMAGASLSIPAMERGVYVVNAGGYVVKVFI